MRSQARVRAPHPLRLRLHVRTMSCIRRPPTALAACPDANPRLDGSAGVEKAKTRCSSRHARRAKHVRPRRIGRGCHFPEPDRVGHHPRPDRRGDEARGRGVGGDLGVAGRAAHAADHGDLGLPHGGLPRPQLLRRGRPRLRPGARVLPRGGARRLPHVASPAGTGVRGDGGPHGLAGLDPDRRLPRCRVRAHRADVGAPSRADLRGPLRLRGHRVRAPPAAGGDRLPCRGRGRCAHARLDPAALRRHLRLDDRGAHPAARDPVDPHRRLRQHRRPAQGRLHPRGGGVRQPAGDGLRGVPVRGAARNGAAPRADLHPDRAGHRAPDDQGNAS